MFAPMMMGMAWLRVKSPAFTNVTVKRVVAVDDCMAAVMPAPDIILIGNPAHIKQEAEEWGLKNISKAKIIDPLHFDKTEEYAEKLAETVAG